MFSRKHTRLLSKKSLIQFRALFLGHSLAYLQCLGVRGIGLKDVNILSTYFSGNLRLDGCFVADEAKDGIGWVFGELADKLELDGVFISS